MSSGSLSPGLDVLPGQKMGAPVQALQLLIRFENSEITRLLDC